MVYKKVVLYILILFGLFLISFKFFLIDQNNIIISSSNDFDNETFINKDEGCGIKENEKGSRKKKSLVVIENLKNIKVTNGTFECSNKSIFYINNSQNIIVSNINASKGSDNIFQIDNSFSIIENSNISFNSNNKCIEADNGIIIIFNNLISNCTIALEIEKNDGNNFVAVVLLDNTFQNIDQNIIWCRDNENPEEGNIYLFKKNNNLNGLSYFSIKHPCLNEVSIDQDLEKAIKDYNFNKIEKLLIESIKNFKET